jgi:hypothetical protein
MNYLDMNQCQMMRLSETCRRIREGKPARPMVVRDTAPMSEACRIKVEEGKVLMGRMPWEDRQ